MYEAIAEMSHLNPVGIYNWIVGFDRQSTDRTIIIWHYLLAARKLWGC